MVLPDYQGVGVGVKFINAVTQHYCDNGWNVNLTTTTPALVHALCRNKAWLLLRKSRIGPGLEEFMKAHPVKAKSIKAASKNRITYSFNYKSR